MCMDLIYECHLSYLFLPSLSKIVTSQFLEETGVDGTKAG